ncbi:MAG: amidinotransferase [Hymenobacter sp.]|nr:MAG: amidinotransferase [Hymenobacter sp.]
MFTIASTVLMVRPAAFGYNAETAANNSFQVKDANLNLEKVLQEFDGFMQQLQQAEVEVIVVNDTIEPQKPDAVFPNNWFCTLPNGKLVLFPMFASNRRLERVPEIITQLKEKLGVNEVEDWTAFERDNMFLEGTGSMVIDHNSKTIYACLSPRTNKILLEKFAAANGYKTIAFTANDEQGQPIYHTNVMMHVGDGYAVICLEAITDEAEREAVVESLKATNHTIIDITYEQMNHFAGNMLQVMSKTGQKITVMSQSAYTSLLPLQIETLMTFSQLLPVAITTIETTGGGSARCMMAEVFY